MSDLRSITVDFADRASRLRAALIRGQTGAIREMLDAAGPRAAAMLAWVSQAARPGTALADRIEAAAEDAGASLSRRLQGDIEAQFAFSRGMAIAHASRTNADARERLLLEWRQDDPGSLIDFGTVALAFDLDPAAAELLTVLDGSPERTTRSDRVPGLADMLLRIAPRLSRRATLSIARIRPDLVARAAAAECAAAPPSPRDNGRIISLLTALATAGSTIEVGPARRPAMPLLVSIARGRQPDFGPTDRVAVIERLHRLGWRAAVPVAGEMLAAGFATWDADTRLAARCGDLESLFDFDPDDDSMLSDAAKARRRVRERCDAIEANAGGAAELIGALVRIGTPEAIELVVVAGRRHIASPVRRAALAQLVRAGIGGRGSIGEGPVLDLARAQLRDPDSTVADDALDVIAKRVSPRACARILLAELPGMPAITPRTAVGWLVMHLPPNEHPVAIRRLLETGDHEAMVRFIAGVDEWRQPGLWPTLGHLQARMTSRAKEWIGLSVTQEHATSFVVPSISQTIESGNAFESEHDVGPAGRALLREAARHWTRGSGRQRMADRAQRLQRRFCGFGPLNDGPTELVDQGAQLCVLAMITLMHGDAAAADLRAELVRDAFSEELITVERALGELARLPATTPVRAIWRRVVRSMSPLEVRSMLMRSPATGRGELQLPSWIYQELVALSLLASVHVTCHLRDLLPPRSTDADFDAKFIPPALSQEHGRACFRLGTIMQSHVQKAFDWIEAEGRRLLGRPVQVRATLQAAGYTSAPVPPALPVVFVSPDPILVEGPEAADIVRAVGLHEIGHHLHDFSQPDFARESRRMRRMGLHSLHNLICDERLERCLRSQSAQYGRLLDASIRHHFADIDEPLPLSALAAVSGRDETELRGSIAAGVIPGTLCHVEAPEDAPPDAARMRAAELMAVPGLATPWQVFMWALRTGADPSRIACARAREALRLVPADLRSRTARQVADLCIRVADALGGVEAERRRRAELRELVRQCGRIAALSEIVAAAAGAKGAEPGGIAPAEDDAGRILDGSHEPGDDPVVSPAADRSIVRLHRERARRRREAALATGRESDRSAPLPNTEVVDRDPAAHRALLASVQSHVRIVRRSLDQLGTVVVDEPAVRRGHRLDAGQARLAAIAPRLNMLVGHRSVEATDCHLGVLIDRSGSMHGPKIELARRFGALVAESARGQRGLDGWVAAFDDDTWYDMGGFNACAIAGLTAGGGNNDAAALGRAGSMMRRSRRRHRVLVFISDGEPTECSVAAFHAAAARLERDHGIVVIHVVIDQMDRRAVLPRCVDLTETSMNEAVRRFAGLLLAVVRRGGRAVVADRHHAEQPVSDMPASDTPMSDTSEEVLP